MAVAPGRDPLAGVVRALRSYDLAGHPPGQHVGLPSAWLVLVVPVEQTLDLELPGTGVRAMTSCLAGLDDAPVTIHHDGTQRGIQADLSPLAVRRLFGVPAAELRGRAVELEDVLGRRTADELLERVHAADCWPARTAVLRAALSARLGADSPDGVRPELRRAWSLLARSGGRIPVRDVAADVGWSSKHLADCFRATVGTGPKTVARLVRFSRSVRLLGAGEGLADVAHRCGYADQPHLNREWARLAGTSPTRWLRDDVLANVQDRPGDDVEDDRHDLS